MTQHHLIYTPKRNDLAPEDTYTKRMQVMVSEAMMAQLTSRALELGISRSAYIRDALAAYDPPPTSETITP